MTSKSSNRGGSVWARAIAPIAGLKPTSPVYAAGRRVDPPPSVPRASGTLPAATAATEPPLEPPGVNAGFQGLRVVPNRRLPV